MPLYQCLYPVCDEDGWLLVRYPRMVTMMVCLNSATAAGVVLFQLVFSDFSGEPRLVTIDFKVVLVVCFVPCVMRLIPCIRSRISKRQSQPPEPRSRSTELLKMTESKLAACFFSV